MTHQHRRILEDALVALERTTGIRATVCPAHDVQTIENTALIEVQSGSGPQRFGADITNVDRFATPAMLKTRGELEGEVPLLVAPYISREIADRCRLLHLSFIDTAGNAYLEAPGLLIYSVGQARPVELRRYIFRSLNSAGLKITFALLSQPQLLADSYRNIATAAGVALGSVGPCLQDLKQRGYLHLGKKSGKWIDPNRMVEEWTTHYPITLRPKLVLGLFRADLDQLRKLDMETLKAAWGGEPAAEKLTKYLKPAQFTIYTGEPIARLVAAGRMRAEPAGNVEVLEKFWNFSTDFDRNNVVPPILAYADLLATGDGRNAEVARLIYDQQIVPGFGDAA